MSDEVRVGGSAQTHSSTLTESGRDSLWAILLTAEGLAQCPLPRLSVLCLRLSSQPAGICVITLLLCVPGVTLQPQENTIHRKEKRKKKTGCLARTITKRYLEDLGSELI